MGSTLQSKHLKRIGWPGNRVFGLALELARELEAQGFLTIKNRKGPLGNTSNLYQLALDPESTESTGVCPQRTEGMSTVTPPPGSTASTITSHSFEPVIEPKTNSIPVDEIISLYHAILPDLASVRLTTSARRKSVKARWGTSKNTQSLLWWKEYFELVKSTPFLNGRNDRGWKADFDFLVTESKFASILEGKYENSHQ